MAATQVFATPAQMRVLGVVAGRLDEVPDATLQVYLSAASSVAIGILRKRFTFPLATFGDDLALYVCQLATYLLWQATGYNRIEGQLDTIRNNYKDAMASLKDVANRRADLDGVTDATPDVEEGGAVIASDPLLVEGSSAYDGADILAGPQP